MATKPNWLVYQSIDTGAPAEFAELLWLDNTLILRTGRFMTFGESRIHAFANAQLLQLEIAQQQQSVQAAGFKLVREWTFDPARFDFDLLQHELELATAATIAQLRAEYPRLNAFALATDDGAMTIFPIAHVFDSSAAADDDTLWSPDEWGISEHDEHFDVAYRLILSQHRDDLTKVVFRTFKSGFTKAALAALQQLDAQGVFGNRDQRVVLYHVTDDDQASAMVKLLQSPALYRRWKAWISQG